MTKLLSFPWKSRIFPFAEQRRTVPELLLPGSPRCAVTLISGVRISRVKGKTEQKHMQERHDGGPCISVREKRYSRESTHWVRSTAQELLRATTMRLLPR